MHNFRDVSLVYFFSVVRIYFSVGHETGTGIFCCHVIT